MTKMLLLVIGNSVAFVFSLRCTIRWNVLKIVMGCIPAQSMRFIICLKMSCKRTTNACFGCFDAGENNIRTKNVHKNTKVAVPKTYREENSKEQMPYIRELLDRSRCEVLQLPNYGADDIIGTLAEKVDKENIR